jgi:3-deoxy-7-phosphoheptulonate synthase
MVGPDETKGHDQSMTTTHHVKTRDLRVESFEPLMAPRELLAELPLDDEHAEFVADSREEVRHILAGDDDRLVVVVGPCSVHDPAAAREYGERLAMASDALEDELRIVMRVYFEKPRTTVGWKGLINDPHLDGSHDIPHGLRLARQLLLDILGLGLPVGCEFLDPTSPHFIADTVTWGAIGARTTESQVHRQLASGLSMPVGFKNGTDGDIQVALDACQAARSPHVFFGIDDLGRAAVISTTGNPDGHVILRGGRSGPNFGAESVATALERLRAGGLPQRLLVDASHANSGKDHHRQAAVVRDIADQVAAGQCGIAGVMLESFLVEGRQEIGPRGDLVYGQSVTDACLGWATTADLLRTLADAVRRRRSG